MVLLVDLGNTFLKWAEFSDDEFEHYLRENVSDNDVNLVLDECWTVLVKPDRILVSSVASPEQYQKVVNWCENNWQLTPDCVVSPSSGHGIDNSYSEPATLGSDRWLAMVAAYQQHKCDICIIDCGTAITADIVLANGKHLGGYIAPGLLLMQQSLLKGTAGIVAESLKLQNRGLLDPGISTTECVQRGAIINALGFIEQIRAHLERRFDSKFTYLLTGGDAEYLIPHLSINVYHAPLLVLEGLALMAASEE